jgi:hypothetical protein
MACFSREGKVPEDKDRLARMVMGVMSESMQHLSSLVGMGSREHVESDELKINFFISVHDAGARMSRMGGG